MEMFICEQLKTVAESCILGLIFGVGYDIIRIVHILCCIASYSGEKVQSRSTGAFLIFLFLDLVYMLLVTFVYSVFLYHENHGVFRMYLVIPCVLSFVLYYKTIGCLVMHVSETIVGFCRIVVKMLIIRPVCALYKVLRISSALLWRYTAGMIISVLRTLYRQRYMRQIQRNLSKYIRI